VNFRALDSPQSDSYLRFIPIHRFTRRRIRARVGFSFGRGFLAKR
jgi:hypothetical protein